MGDICVDMGETNSLVIVAIGLSGAGISSSVNVLLFGNGINDSTVQDCSTDFRELRVTVEGERDSNSRTITVLDTPGLECTGGNEHVTESLANIEAKVQLVCRKNGASVPNVVLFVSRFDDERYEEHASRFAKTLRAFNTISDSLFMTETSNVVFLFTHGRDFSEDKRNSFSSVIRSYATFGRNPFPVVVMENARGEQSRDTMNPQKGEAPEDIWMAVFQLIKLQGPNLEETIQSVVYGLKNHTLPVQIAITKSFNSRDRYDKILYELQVRGSSKGQSSLHTALKSCWERINTPKPTEEQLLRILHVFDQRKIFSKSDLPKSDAEIAMFAKALPTELTTAILLKEAFGIEVPYLDLFSFHIGSTYKANFHNYGQPNVFNFDKNQFYIGPWGYLLPGEIKCRNLFTTVDVFKTVPNIEAYCKTRNDDIGVTVTENVDGFELINMPVELGYNILPYETESGKQFSWLREFQLYELVLDLGNCQKSALSAQFIDKVEVLEKYDSKSQYKQKQYRKFFEHFGTHIVTKCNAGGQLLMTGKIADSYSLTRFTNLSLDYWVFKPYWWTTYNLRMAYLEHQLKKLLYGERGVGDDWIVEVAFRDSKHTSTKIISNKHELALSHECKQWITSADNSPMLLNHNLVLVPISDVARKVDEKKANFIEDAYKDLYSDVKPSDNCSLM